MSPQEFRRHLHRHPELSFAEHRTARFIADALDKCGIAHRTVATTGVLARIEGRGDLRRAVVLRADIDALPIHEATGLEYASQNEGVMHACGHDIHAAVLFGTLQRLSAAPDFEGTVFGLFQPGEECNPGGASLVLAESPFEGYDVRAVIGEHTDSALDVGTFGFREGKYMAASDELRFTVRGRGGHAAMRGTIRDAVQAQAALVLGVLSLNLPERIVSIGRVEAGGATNVIPDEVRLEGTMRTFSADDRRTTKERIREIAAQTASQYGVEIAVDISDGYPCVVNDARLTRTAEELAGRMFRTERLALRPTAEDFGFYGERYPSLFYRLGVGRAAGGSHTPAFSPDERSITAGVEFMTALTLKIANEDEKRE